MKRKFAIYAFKFICHAIQSCGVEEGRREKEREKKEKKRARNRNKVRGEKNYSEKHEGKEVREVQEKRLSDAKNEK